MGRLALRELLTFVREQQWELAKTQGISSRGVKTLLHQVNRNLDDVRPEYRVEGNEEWVQLRMEQQILASHLEFRKNQKKRQRRIKAKSSTIDKKTFIGIQAPSHSPTHIEKARIIPTDSASQNKRVMKNGANASSASSSSLTGTSEQMRRLARVSLNKHSY